MFVITVVPLRRGITIPTLSYFSSITYPIGTLLTIPVRNAQILGLVTESNEVSAAKTALRAATFSLKKLPPQTNTSTLGNTLVETATELAHLYAAPLGLILYNILSPEIRNGEILLPHTSETKTTASHTPQLFQARTDERMLAYRSLVRETFAHCGSVLIVVPSSTEALAVREALESGINDRIIMLTSGSTKSSLKKAYEELGDYSKVKLIIATPLYAVLERHDITLTIIEHARSPYFREQHRPYLDYRDVLRVHAKKSGRRLIMGDLLLRTEEEAHRRNDLYMTYGESPKRIELTGKLEVIDLPKPGGDGTPFVLFDPRTKAAILDVYKKRGRVFLFAARRGLAPLVACADCGFVFRSKECGAPYSLMRTVKHDVEERWFVCSVTGERIRAAETCPECGSWKLKERGIGVQHVSDELHKIFPGTPIILFDHSTARTYKKALLLRDTFYKTKGAIMLGTSMALPYLTQSIDLSVVVNMDALLATPTWRLEEENLATLLTIREHTKGSVLVQMRAAESGVLTHAKLGSVENFYTEELALRKEFGYPPYSTFIHFTWQGTPAEVKEREQELLERFKDFGLTVYQNPTAHKDSPIAYGLLRIPKGAWPNSEIESRILATHPSVRVMINPDRIV